MKVLYLESKSRTKPEEYNTDINFIEHLPKQVFLVYSIQFKGQALEMKKALEANKIQVMGFQQVLGCTKLKTDYPIILIGSGRFHAYNLALQNKHPLILYSNGSSLLIGEKELSELKRKKMAAINLFLHAQSLGIIVSTKPGQESLKKANKLKEMINNKYSEKEVSIFISSNINLAELENFNVDFWINTACPGLFNDSRKLINIDDILEFL